MDLDAIVGASSVLVAVAALVFAIYSFALQQARAERHAVASVKPLLAIRSLNYDHHKAILLVNYGLGPAIIRKAAFSKGSRTTDRVVDLFDLPIEKWERFQNLPHDRAIPPQGEVVLVEQTLDHLIQKGHDEDDGLALLSRWREQKTGIRVEIAYEDILGNGMPPLTEVLN